MIVTKPSSYWQERFNDLNENLLNKGEEYNKALISAYDEAAQNIQKEIEVFYERFAANNLISLSDAKKILSSDERKSFQMTLDEYIKVGKQNALDGKWIKELESASDIYRMDRLRALQLQMRQQVEILEAKKATGLTDTLSKVYEDGYYHTIYEIQKGLEIGSAFATLNTNKIEKVLANPWTADGKNFSQKIWGSDRTNLLYQLDTKFTQAIIRGDAPNGVIKEMANTLNVSKSAASRLVMTESAYFASASRLDGYKALDVEEFEYVATLDLKTSDLCQSMDGQHFPMSQYEVGVNAPPLHPWCRSTTVPYFDDEFTADETRAARGEDGKTYKVPGDMKYKDWSDKYVKKPVVKDNDKGYNKNKRTALQNQLQYVFKGEKNFIPTNTNIKSAKIIAGTGVDDSIRDEPRLIAKYGGALGEWQKKVGRIESDKYMFDVHWYEKSGKQYEMKLKNRKER